MPDDYVAYTIPGIKTLPKRMIVGDWYYIPCGAGDPLATVHFDCYAPWMAPPKPPRVEKLRTCDFCGSLDTEVGENSAYYWLYCQTCKHRGPRRYNPDGGGIKLPGRDNQIVEEDR